MYSLIYNNRISSDLGISIKTRPIIPTPKKQVNSIPIPGGETLYEDLEEYDDIEITVEFNFVFRDDLKGKFRNVRHWLLDDVSNRLFFSDDKNYFYKVKNIEISDLTTKFKVKGDFSVKFICEPYMYRVLGMQKINLNKNTTLYNSSWLPSKPYFFIEGEGIVTLIVNGNSINLNVGQNIEVDVDKRLIYRKGNIENERKTGLWKDLYLVPGKNTIGYKVSSGSVIKSIKIIPNWREI